MGITPCVVALAAPFVTTDALLAQDWVEAGDAGHLVATAQAVSGSGPLGAILGGLTAGDVDLYRIYVSDWSLFSATTSNSVTNLDTQLFMFDGAGNGIIANDDSVGTRSTLPQGASQYASLLPGQYLVAVSGFNRDPRDSGGNLIFPSSPFNGVFGPNAGAGALAGWDGAGAAGDYRIDFTGASFLTSTAVPLPTGAAMALAGMGLLAARRRR